MALPFRPAYNQGRFAPVTQHWPLKSGETCVTGSPMTRNANEVDEIDTDDVTLVVGVAASANQSAFGYDAGDQPSSPVVTGRADTIPVFVATTNTVFTGQLSNDTTMVVPVAATHVGVSYGIRKQSGGEWTVDTNDTTNVVVKVIKVVNQGPECSDPYGLVWFKFLSSTLLV